MNYYRDQIGPIFTNDAKLLKYVSALVPLLAAFQVADGIQACANVWMFCLCFEDFVVCLILKLKKGCVEELWEAKIVGYFCFCGFLGDWNSFGGIVRFSWEHGSERVVDWICYWIIC